MASVNDEITFDSGDWSSEGFVYRVFSITSTVVQLRLFKSGTWWSNPHAVEFDTSTGVWSDPSSTEVPNAFASTLTGTRTTSVSGYPTKLFGWGNTTSTSHYWEITTPSWARSGTSTEGSTSPSGSTYINSQGQIVFVISASSPSSDGNVAYKIYRRPIGGALEQAYVVPHTSGSSTEWTIGLNYSLYDRWELRVESSTALVQSGILAVYTTYNKKVFRNFW